MQLRHRILAYTKNLARQGLALTDASLSELERLQCRLTAEQKSYPSDLELSPARLQLKAHSYDAGIYVALHLGWNQCHCNLYRLFVPGMREAVGSTMFNDLPPQVVLHYQSACLAAARRTASLLAQLYHAGLRKPLAIPNLGVGIHQIVRIVHHLWHLSDTPDDTLTVQVDLQHAYKMVRLLQPVQIRGPKAGEMLEEAEILIHDLGTAQGQPRAGTAAEMVADGEGRRQSDDVSSWPRNAHTRHLASKGSLLDDLEGQTVKSNDGDCSDMPSDANPTNTSLASLEMQAGESLVSLQRQLRDGQRAQHRECSGC